MNESIAWASAVESLAWAVGWIGVAWAIAWARIKRIKMLLDSGHRFYIENPK